MAIFILLVIALVWILQFATSVENASRGLPGYMQHQRGSFRGGGYHAFMSNDNSRQYEPSFERYAQISIIGSLLLKLYEFMPHRSLRAETPTYEASGIAPTKIEKHQGEVHARLG